MNILYIQSELRRLFGFMALFISLILIFSVVPNAQAQEPEMAPELDPEQEIVPSPVSVEGTTLLADVNVTEARIKTNLERETTVSLTLQNSLGLQSGIRYGLEIYPIEEGSSMIDAEVSLEALTLKEGESVTKELTYRAPASLPAGTYRVHVVSWTDKGLLLAMNIVGEVTFEDSPIENPVLLSGCDLSTANEDGTALCTLENTGSETETVELVVNFTVGNLFGFDLGDASVYNVTLEPNSEIEQEIKIPEEVKDIGLTIQASLLGESRETLDRNTFRKGASKINTSITNSVATLEDEFYRIVVSVKNQKNSQTIVATPISATDICIEMSAPVNAIKTDLFMDLSCEGEVVVSLRNSQNEIVDQDSIRLPEPIIVDNQVTNQEEDPISNNKMIMLIMLTTAAIMAVVILLRNKIFRAPLILLLGLFLVPAISYGASAGASKTYTCDPNVQGGGAECFDDNVTAHATVVINKTTFQPGEQITGSVSLEATRGDEFPINTVGVAVGGDCTSDGCPAGNIFLPSFFGSANFTYNDTNTIIHSISGLNAPSTPGNYVISFAARITNALVNGPDYLSNWSYASIPITVAAPPSVTLTPRAR